MTALALASLNDHGALTIGEIKKVSDVKNPSQNIRQLLECGAIYTPQPSEKKYAIRRGLFASSVLLDIYRSFGFEEGHKLYYRYAQKLSDLQTKDPIHEN